jgi:hypothetical protein
MTKYKKVAFSFNVLVTNAKPYFIQKIEKTLNVTLSET